MRKRAICAGHVCLDITPAIPDTGARRVQDWLRPGKLVDIGAAVVSPGGSVSNTGLCMKKLGADVSLMGKVGADALGGVLATLFQAQGVEDSLIRQPDVTTSYTVILALPGLDRIFLHHSGANHAFYADDVPWAEAQDAALIHFGYPTVMRSMYENGGEELLRLMRRAHEAGMATSLDMSSIDPDSEAGRVDWADLLARVLPHVDFFEPSAEELCFMLDREAFRAWRRRAGDGDVCECLTPEDIGPLAERCMALGAKVLMLKCGAPGMYLRSAPPAALAGISPRLELDCAAWGGRAFFEPSYVPDRVVSGTGAGDTSIGAFLTAVLNGCDPEWAMHLAAAAGACCVAQADSLSGIPSLPELEGRIRAGWRKRGDAPHEARP